MSVHGRRDDEFSSTLSEYGPLSTNCSLDVLCRNAIVDHVAVHETLVIAVGTGKMVEE